MTIGVLASGGLGLTVLEALRSEYDIRLVLTDSQSKGIIDLCAQWGVPCFIGNPRKGKAVRFLSDKPVEVIISVNYLFIVERDIINHASKLCFNIHGSLLPKYRGRTPHVWAIINNEQEAGVTAHLIDDGCDTGDIIGQTAVPIEPYDTGADILNRYAQLYVPLIKEVMGKLASGIFAATAQDHHLATYFGKRVPSDGGIDWGWQRERIRNWVRAQASPYPGAFSFINGSKFTIDEVRYHEHGYHADMRNGTVLCVEPLVVKTPNGALEITRLREARSDIRIGDVFQTYNT